MLLPIKRCRGTLQCHRNKLTRRAGQSSPLLLVTSSHRTMQGQRSLGRGRKSPTNTGAVACSRAGSLGMREEIQVPGEGQEQGETSFMSRRQQRRDKLISGDCLQTGFFQEAGFSDGTCLGCSPQGKDRPLQATAPTCFLGGCGRRHVFPGPGSVSICGNLEK